MRASARIVFELPWILVVIAIACGPRGGPRTPRTHRTASVGTVSFLVTDAERRDVVDPQRDRAWMVQLFYPTEPATVTGVYAADPALLEVLVADHYYEATAAHLRAWARAPAAAIDGAPPRTPSPLPIVTLSPGLGFARLNYAELAAALVARGYIVAVIDHPYIGYSHLPDGRVLFASQDAVLSSDDPADALPRVRDWTRDIKVTLDRLVAGAARALAPGLAIDFDRITAAGHSIGGTAAVDVCSADPRVHACIDFEGFLEGTRAATRGVDRPTLAVFSRAKGRPAVVKPGRPDPDTAMLAVLGRRGQPSWIVKVTGGSHTSFSDAPLVLPETLSRFGGELMSATRSMELYSGLVDAFARAYDSDGRGDPAFQRFLDAAPETRGRRASASR